MTAAERGLARSHIEPFFVHIGSFVAVIVYFVVLGRGRQRDPAVLRRVVPEA